MPALARYSEQAVERVLIIYVMPTNTEPRIKRGTCYQYPHNFANLGLNQQDLPANLKEARLLRTDDIDKYESTYHQQLSAYQDMETEKKTTIITHFKKKQFVPTFERSMPI